VTKQSRNHYVVTGDVEFVTNWCNEVITTYQLTNDKGMKLVTGSEPICDFVKNEKRYYPDLLKFSNAPEPGTCPLPKGIYTVTNYVIPLDSVPNAPPGNYELKVTYTTEGRQIGGYLIKVSYKMA
jgi:ganglioside GM2 activator